MNFSLLPALLAAALPALSQTVPAAAPGLLTPEKLWQLGRLGELAVSPDGRTVAYTVTRTRPAGSSLRCGFKTR